MKQDITRAVLICPACHTPYDPDLGDVCQCPTEMLPEEPAVKGGDWEDHPFRPAKKETAP